VAKEQSRHRFGHTPTDDIVGSRSKPARSSGRSTASTWRRGPCMWKHGRPPPLPAQRRAALGVSL